MRGNVVPRKRVILLAAAMLPGIVSSCWGKVIYVDDDANGLGNGSSWQNAYKYLQDALTNVKAAEKPVEIRIAQGVYTPDRGMGQKLGDRLASFDLFSGVTLQGGYAGLSMPDPDARDVKVCKTVLSGDLAGNDADVSDPRGLASEPTRSENSCNVVEIVGASDIRLEGLTIAGGHADISKRGKLASTLTGAAVYATRSGPLSFADCTFTGNYAVFGGACYIQSCTSVAVNDCSFRRNSAGEGGGLNVYASGLRLSRCDISENHARDFGGGMTADGLEKTETTTVVDCVFSGNRAGDGGAVKLLLCKIDFLRCTIKDNSSTRWGGGVAISAGTQWEAYRFEGCHFSSNSTVTAGGALNVYSGGTVDLTNCILSGNTAEEGGAICAFSIGRLKVVNCTATENRATSGKFVFLGSDSQYHAILGPATIVNSIIVESGNAICTQDMRVSLNYSLLSGGLDPIVDPNNNVAWGTGNINVDPAFAASGHWDANGTSADQSDDFYVVGDYHLKSQAGRFDPNAQSWVQDDITSPCIDAGDPNIPIGLEPFPNGGRINMGAYGGTTEASKSYFGRPICVTVLAGDVNGDCRVDHLDFALLAAHWLTGQD